MPTCRFTFLTRTGCWFVCNLDQATYLPTYLPIYGKTLQNYFHIWVDPRVPTYLTYLPTYHPNLMAPIVRPPDVFLWSWTSSMPFLRFLSEFGKKNGRKVVLEPPDLRTYCACNRHSSLQLVASGLDPPPAGTHLSMRSGVRASNQSVHTRAPGSAARFDPSFPISF